MSARLRLALLAAALACAAAPAAAQEPVVLAHAMVDVLAPKTNDIQGVLIDAMDAKGEVDSRKLSDRDWATMRAAVAALREEAAVLRDRPIHVVAQSTDKIFGEDRKGGLTAEQVQAGIDANRAAFNAHAAALLADFDRMAAAVDARNGAAMWELAQGLDHKCGACHDQFWYPDWQEDENDDAGAPP
jgi:cytochrome c556